MAQESDSAVPARPTLVVLIAAGVLVGTLIAPFAAGLATSGGPDKIAVVSLEGAISGGSAAEVVANLERAREDPSVAAVVLRVNSPGGGAGASESLYLATKRLAEEKPVVVSVAGAAASGAYYASLPADEIYVKPASIVGSVGVIAPLPPEVEPNDVLVTTGPEKVGVASERDFKYTIETLKQAFVNAVMANRGDELEVPRSTVARAGIFSGAVAVRNGYADEIGGLPTAISRAAELADLDEYQLTRFRPDGTVTYISQAAYVASDVSDKRIVSPSKFTGIGQPGATYGNVLMLPPRIAFAGTASGNATATTNATAGGDGR